MVKSCLEEMVGHGKCRCRCVDRDRDHAGDGEHAVQESRVSLCRDKQRLVDKRPNVLMRERKIYESFFPRDGRGA